MQMNGTFILNTPYYFLSITSQAYTEFIETKFVLYLYLNTYYMSLFYLWIHEQILLFINRRESQQS